MTLQVWVFALMLWALVVTCVISSINAQPFSRKQRWTWILIVSCIPIVGLLAYLPFSIRRDELPTAFLMRGSTKNDRKKPRLPAPR